MKMLPLVAIVGRPNVGKSTFFNRLVGKKQAIVYDQPGVTRDRNFGLADWAGLAFQVVDTGGYEADPSSDLFAQMRRQVEQAIREAQVVMLLVDARAGLTPDDEAMAERLRKADKKVFLIANKIDHEKNDASLGEFFKLGFDQIYPISAEHGRGVADLLDELKIELEKDLQEEPAAEEDRAIRVAIIGRPNVGKSTLINRLFGAPRAVVHPEPGTTRDPLDIEMTHEDQRYVFVDTAGIRKKSHSEGKIEKVSVLKSFETIEKSHIVLLVVDATIGLTAQDGKVAQHAFERHRPMIFLVNKWDLMSEKNWADFVKDIETRFDFLRFVPILKLSAKTGLGVERVFREIKDVYQEYNKRLGTGELNRVFQKMVEANPPPSVSGKSINLFYMTQIAVRPPRFIILTNHPKLIPEAYKRYLLREIRAAFSFSGTPIILDFRARKKKPFHA